MQQRSYLVEEHDETICAPTVGSDRPSPPSGRTSGGLNGRAGRNADISKRGAEVSRVWQCVW